MSPRKPKPPSLDDIAHGWRIAALLADELRDAQARAEQLGAEAHAAIKRNAEAHALVSELLRPYRALCTALVGGAGTDRPVKLSEALAAAEAVLGVTDPPHPPKG